MGGLKLTSILNWAYVFLGNFKLTCLFCMKVEGKIEEGWKVVGLVIFPLFGTTLKRKG
jgi:hypothetical protein